jgi:hypothetical protein
VYYFADGYYIPFQKNSHPIEITWHFKAPIYRRPHSAVNSSNALVHRLPRRPGDFVNGADYLEEASAPNRVKYVTNNLWANLPAMDYVAFVGPSANFAGVEERLPFLRALLKISGQPQTEYFAARETSKLSPQNLVCSTRGAVLGMYCM